MPSPITQIYVSYENALKESKSRYEDMHIERFNNSGKFYNDFFKNLVKDYSGIVKNPSEKRRIKGLIEQLFGTTDIKFAAIDGTCYKKQLENYIVFFGASYCVRGSIAFSGDPPRVKYEKYSTEWDTSMVAYIPIPFAELGDVSEEQFISSDENKINLSSIHLQLMLLAEVFLAYDLVKSPSFAPKVLLWDQSISGIMAGNEFSPDSVDMVGYKYGKGKLTIQDIILGCSHPYNDDVEIPSTKKFRRYRYILSKLKNSPQKLSVLAESCNISKNELKNSMAILFDGYDNDIPLVYYDEENDELKLNIEYDDSWEFVIGIFEKICKKLFKDKNIDVLMYEKENDGYIRKRWMSPNDLKFLIATGIRALIEECWRKNILLLGVTKDSSTRYLSQNYLGVMRSLGNYDFNDVLLPWTDRTFLETLPYHDDNLNAPWATIEFDSAFMTLHLKRNEKDEEEIAGVQDYIVSMERLSAKSLVQFYLKRKGKRLSSGHAIFIDRLLFPSFDKRAKRAKINNEIIGNVEPILFLNNTTENKLQDISIFLLDILTKNLYPEVIGYPDPLHKADWGAKSILKKIKPMINDSDILLKSKPLTKTLRQSRDEIRRT